ncbi:MAG TPA: FHA domain-containing protein [Casimicrobiaceae bacterium]
MIWVEILSRHRDVVARHRCDGAEIHIGRGYDNDVIIDDPFVAPRHLRVYRGEDGKLIAEDLASANGLFVDDGGNPVPSVVIDGDTPLRIGRTHLRIREESHQVAAERAAVPAGRSWPLALGLAAAVIALELVSAWLSETTEPQVSRYLLPVLLLLVLLLAWTSAWAVLSRVFAGQARFERHLVIALTMLLAFSVYEEVCDVGAFSLSWRVLADYSYIGAWALFATLCFLHLREIGPGRLKLKAGVVGGFAVAVIGAQTLAQSEMRAWVTQQSYLHDLKPPSMRIVPAQTDAAFFADAKNLKAKLDRARKEEPPAGDLLSGLDSDE